MDRRTLDTARMLVQIAPAVFADDRFALKGGTAINLFERDLPRLSVDLDLVLVDGALDRLRALDAIDDGLRTATTRLEAEGYRIAAGSKIDDRRVTIRVQRDGILVKVEVNPVLRGTLRPVRRAELVPAARATLRTETALPVLAADELYGGKLVAAMDRQHPRDLFDVRELFALGPLTPEVVRCFVAYLACHDRPPHEVLFPTEREIGLAYDEAFVGMTASPVALAALLETRRQMMTDLPRALDDGARKFLRTLVRAEPDFAALGLPQLEPLPAMQWKLANLRKLRATNPAKLEAQAVELGRRLQEIA